MLPLAADDGKDDRSLEAKSHPANSITSHEAVDCGKQAQSTMSEPEYVQGTKLWSVMASVTLVYFLILLDTSILSTATPEITKAFRALEDIGWYAAAYVLTCATLQPLAGKIYANFDTKWTYFCFFLLFELGSLLCAVSESSTMFIVSRAVAGMGASGLQNGSLNIIAACVPMHKRPGIMGILIGGGQLGIVAGPLIGGLFTQFVTWRWCFYINLPIGGLVAALLAFIRIPEPFAKPLPMTVLKDLHNKLDFVGFVLFAPASIMFLLAVQWGGNQYDWDSSVVIGLFCGAGALFLIWLTWNYLKKDAAMLPLGMLRKRYVWASSLFGSFLAGGLFLIPYYMSVYFQGIRGNSAAISGVYLLPSVLSQLLFSVLGGRLTGQFGFYLPWAVASGVFTSVGYGVLTTLTPYTSAGKWIGYQIISGAGRGCGLAIPIVAVQHTLTPQEIPTAMSLITFTQTLSGSIFLSAGATILTNSLTMNLKEQVPGIDIQTVLAAGANGIRDVVAPEQLSGALKAYAESVDNVFYLCLGLALGCLALAPLMGWVDIRKEKTTRRCDEKAAASDAA